MIYYYYSSLKNAVQRSCPKTIIIVDRCFLSIQHSLSVSILTEQGLSCDYYIMINILSFLYSLEKKFFLASVNESVHTSEN